LRFATGKGREPVMTLSITLQCVVTATCLVLAGNAAAASAPPAWCAAAIAYSNANDGISVLVLRDGRPICASPDITTPHELYSGTKSMVGLMAAVAVKDKLLTLDELASDTLTEWRGDPTKSKITLRELLSMTSGQPPRGQQFMGYQDSVNAPLTAAPGVKFQYGPTPLQTFGEIMRRKLAAGGRYSNPRDFIERRILTPLGVQVGAWRNGPDGNPLMPEGLSLSAKEWVKIGEFVRAGGKVGGKSLVDPAAFAELFKGSAVNPAYGLTWWLPHASTAGGPTTDNTDIAFRANELPSDMVIAGGAGRQRLYVIPSQKLTIVRLANFDIAAARAGIRKKSNWSDAQFILLITKGTEKPPK
jgi:CubicO group peptidase (beta-lactamase class C family)